jgi:hypothetical protein
LWNIAFYDAKIWTHQKSLEISEMWCWRRTKKVSWTDRVKNENVLKESRRRNSLHTIRRRKAN